MVHFSSTLQKCVTQSSTEAEFVALSEATKTITWLRRVLNELGIHQKPTVISEDNSGAIRWSSGTNDVDFKRRKHLDIRFHYIREKVLDGTVTIVKVPTSKMKADFLTKPLSTKHFLSAVTKVGIIPIEESSRKGVLRK